MYKRQGESFTDAVIREVWEETGLKISEPKLCGIKDWMKDEETRYIAVSYTHLPQIGVVFSCAVIRVQFHFFRACDHALIKGIDALNHIDFRVVDISHDRSQIGKVSVLRVKNEMCIRDRTCTFKDSSVDLSSTF